MPSVAGGVRRVTRAPEVCHTMPRMIAVTNPKDSTAASTFICHLISIVASLAAGGKTAGPLGRWVELALTTGL